MWTLMGILPGLLFVLLAWQRTSGVFFLVCLEIGLFFSIGLGLLVLAYEVYLRITHEIPANFFWSDRRILPPRPTIGLSRNECGGAET